MPGTAKDNTPQNSDINDVTSGTYFYKSSDHHRVYSPYGHCLFASNQLGFTGIWVNFAGEYPLGNGYRTYRPLLMRFMSPDSASPFAAGGLNAYAYCVGDPANRTDPSGHSSRFSFLRTRTLFSPARRNLPATVYSVHRSETSLQFVSYRKISPQLNMNIVERAGQVTDGYDLIGFHGSRKEHTQSLESGVNASHLKRNLLGNGFYTSTNYHHAAKYTGADGVIFGVYGKKISNWRVGVQFDRPAPDILLIRPPAFDNIIVRSEIRMPLYILHPIKGDRY